MARVRCITEMGMGVDVHGRDATKAAKRAVSDAIRHSSISFVRAIGKTPDQMFVDVTIGVPNPEAVDKAAVAKELPYGTVTVNAVKGGLEIPAEQGTDSILIANVRGPFSMIRALVPLLRVGSDSVIVNVSSISAFTGSGSNIGYCAAKAALDTMTLSLARVLGPTIRVLCVSPAAVATDFVAGRGRPQLEKIAEGTPLKRVVEPEDIARTVMACITHLKVSTGTRIVADAGRFLAT